MTDRRAPAALIAGGVGLGASGLAPELWLLAWIGVALTAGGLAAAGDRRTMAVGLVAGTVLTRALWFAWSAPMAVAMLPDAAPWFHGLIGVGFVVVVTLPTLAPTLLAAVAFHHRPWVRLWLPVVWTLSERLQATWTSVASDWLFTQVDVPPIMRSLAWLGLPLTTLACLFVAASVGEAVARGRRRLLAPAAAVLAVLSLLPARQADGLDLLERVGAVHLRSLLEVPAVDGELELVVWPEASFAAQPVVGEGRVHGVTIAALADLGEAEHLVGVLTPARYGQQNAVLAVDRDGRVGAARAKRVLFPFFERAFLGFGATRYVPGTAEPLLHVARRAVVPLVCGEILTRGLVAEGRSAGGNLLVVMASDRYQARRRQPDWQVLAHLRLRAIEYGLPAVYASIEGRASFVGPDGRVLARSDAGAESGVLTWSASTGGEDHRRRDAKVAVLYSEDTPWLRPDCAPGGCSFHALEDLDCASAPASRTVIVAGHADAERMLGRAPGEVAAAAACFLPDLVVLDTCFGASTPVLRAFAGDTLVVAAPSTVPGDGLRYGAALFGDAPAEERARAVASEPPSPLYVGRPDATALLDLEAAVAATPGDHLREQVRSWVPTLVAGRVDGQPVLVPADWRTIGEPPLAPARRFAVYSLWLAGQGEEHREELDRFQACLLLSSTFASFWDGVELAPAGSWVVPAPDGPLDVDDTAPWLDPLVAGLPAPDPGVTPIYVVYAAAPSFPGASCGRCAAVVAGDRAAAVALVRTAPECWPGTGAVRNLTQFTMHELSCAVERARGEPHCAADGACEGRGGCAAPGEAFTGLYCPGAPEETLTGSGPPVRGWVVQKLAHKGAACDACATCDFSVSAR